MLWSNVVHNSSPYERRPHSAWTREMLFLRAPLHVPIEIGALSNLGQLSQPFP